MSDRVQKVLSSWTNISMNGTRETRGEGKPGVAEPRGLSRRQSGDNRCVVGGAHAFILRISSFAGLAPLRFEPRQTGWAVTISLPMCIYSYSLVSLLTFGAVWGLASEILVGTEKAVRMTSRMSQVVSTCDILVVVLTAGAGVYGAPARMRKMLKFMDLMASVDSSLGLEYSMFTERKSCALVVVLLVSITALLVDDFWFYTNSAKRIGRQYETMANYISFYLLYYMVAILELQFAFTASAIRRRYEALNDALAVTAKQINFPVNKVEERSPINIFAVKMAPIEGQNRAVDNVGLLVDSLSLMPDPQLIIRRSAGGTSKLLIPASEAIKRLASLHGNLCTVLRHLNAVYGLPLLVILVSTLLHLIVTPYFLILEIISASNRIHFLVLQFMWVFCHLVRMFVLVEPCHHTVLEGRRTEELVAELLGLAPTVGALPSRLEIFARQLALRTVAFSPLGVCTLDRPLIASVIGAVTTYLVILIQFQKSDL